MVECVLRGYPTDMHSRQSLLLLFLPVLVLSIYSHTLQGSFVFDDRPNIQTNFYIRLTELTLESITRAGFKSYASNRPVTNISFALNYYYLQYNVAGYHIVNILIHITNGILLYLFVKATLHTPVLRSTEATPIGIAFSTALLWLVHPIQTQAVTYIVQRATSLATMFYLLSLVLYAHARLVEDKRKKWPLFVGCILAGLLALGSKEIAVTLPCFIWLYEWYFFQDLRLNWFRRPSVYCLGGLVLIGLVVFVYVVTNAWEHITLPYEQRDFTWIERVLTELRVVVFYIKLLIFPHPSQLNLDHDMPLSRSLLDPVTTLLSAGVITGLLGLALYLAPKQRLISFCLLWFFGNLALESSVIALEIVFEHRLYLPSMLLSLLAVTLASRYIKPAWLKAAGLGIVVLLCSMWTYERNSVWADELTLWRDCVEKSPKKARPHNNLGNALLRQGRLEEALDQYAETLRLDPGFAEAHNNLGDALVNQGRVEEALAHYAEALRIDPKLTEVHNRLGHALLHLGRVEEALRQYTRASRAHPNSAQTHNNLGNVLLHQGRVEEALAQYAKALQIDPHSAEIHTNLGLAWLQQGRLEEALHHCAEALRIHPHSAAAHNNLGLVLLRQGRVEEALHHYAEALRLNPTSAQLRSNLERVLRSMGTSIGP